MDTLSFQRVDKFFFRVGLIYHPNDNSRATFSGNPAASCRLKDPQLSKPALYQVYLFFPVFNIGTFHGS